MAQPVTALPIGSKLSFGRYRVANSLDTHDIIWTIINKDTYTDNKGVEHVRSITLWSTYILDILAFDSKEPSNQNTNIINYGNNRYSQSNIKTWLNSSDPVWFMAQHGVDSAPSATNIISGRAYDTKAGFLNLFRPEELNILMTSTVRTAKNNVIYSGNTLYDITHDKIFLLSAEELNIDPQHFSDLEGEAMGYFLDSSLPNIYRANPTQNLVNSHGISGLTLNVNNPFPYGLRTPNIYTSHQYFSITTAGSLQLTNYAATGNTTGLRPACNISPYVTVSDTPSNGIYSIVSYKNKLRDLDIGDRVMFGSHKVVYDTTPSTVVFRLAWNVADKSHTGYPDNSVTLVTQDVIDFRAFDAGEPENPIINRRTQGNNRYIHSNIYQWLNSEKMAGLWFNPTHSYDYKPNSDYTSLSTTVYDNIPGFLYNFTERERRALLNTRIVTAKNTVSDGGGSDVFSSRIFLLSKTEIGLGTENNIAEGTVLELFKNSNERINYISHRNEGDTYYQVSYHNILPDGHINDQPATTPLTWLLRTPVYNSTYEVRGINAEGNVSNVVASNGGYGIKVGCNLPGDAIVTFIRTDDGVAEYSIEVNSAPTIHVNTIGNNIKTGPFSLQYYIEDYTNTSISVYLDNVIISGYSEITVQPNTENTINISQDIFDSLIIGSHTIKIVANNGLESEFELSFDKINNVVLAEVDTISGPLYKKTETGYAMLLPTTTVDNVFVDFQSNKTLKDKFFEYELNLYPHYTTGMLDRLKYIGYGVEIINIGKIFSSLSSSSYIYIVLKIIEPENPSTSGFVRIHKVHLKDLSISDNYINIDDVDFTKPQIFINDVMNLTYMYSKTNGTQMKYVFRDMSSQLNINEEMYSHESMLSNKVYKQYFSQHRGNTYLLSIENEFNAHISYYESLNEIIRPIRGFSLSGYDDQNFIVNGQFIVNTYNNSAFIIKDNYIYKYIQKYDANEGLIYVKENEIDINDLIISQNIDAEYIRLLGMKACLHETSDTLYIAFTYSVGDPIYEDITGQRSSLLAIDCYSMTIKNIRSYIKSSLIISINDFNIINVYQNEPMLLIAFNDGYQEFFNTSLESIPVDIIKCRKILFANKNLLLGTNRSELLLFKLDDNHGVTKMCNVKVSSDNFKTSHQEGIYEYNIGSSLINRSYNRSVVDINISDIQSFNNASEMGLYPIVEEQDDGVLIYASNKITDKTIKMDLIIQN